MATNEVLGRPIRCESELAYVTFGNHEVVLHREHLEIVARLFPTGRLRLDDNGKGRLYLRLSWAGNNGQRMTVARILLHLMGMGPQEHREAHYRNGNALDLRPENLLLGTQGCSRGTDRTQQEVARRQWLLSQGRDPDGGGAHAR